MKAKSRKCEEITDDMIGMDERICSCASRVIDMILAKSQNAEGQSALKNTTAPPRKPKRTRKNSSRGK